jgi:hypothetical protein
VLPINRKICFDHCKNRLVQAINLVVPVIPIVLCVLIILITAIKCELASNLVTLVVISIGGTSIGLGMITWMGFCSIKIENGLKNLKVAVELASFGVFFFFSLMYMVSQLYATGKNIFPQLFHFPTFFPRLFQFPTFFYYF